MILKSDLDAAERQRDDIPHRRAGFAEAVGRLMGAYDMVIDNKHISPIARREAIADRERLKEVWGAWGGAAAVPVSVRLADELLALRNSVRDLLLVYWGKGDGQTPPPACIQRAHRALGL